MTKAVQALTDAVTANTTATNAAIALMQSLLQNPGAGDPTDAPAIVAATAAVVASTTALNIVLGTPTT